MVTAGLGTVYWSPQYEALRYILGIYKKDMVPELKACTVQGKENSTADNYATGLTGYADTEGWGCLEGSKRQGFTRINSHASKVMLKILQAKLQQYVN